MTFENKTRSLLKAIAYRITTIFLVDFPVVYLLLRNVEAALGLSLAFEIIHSVYYFLYERIWSRIKWGYKWTTK